MYTIGIMARKILHLDLDAFFCAVEELHNPALQGLAFAVGGKPEQRGVVASCSYPARRHGIHSAMPMSQAVRAHPELVIVPARFRAYRNMSRRVMERLHRVTPLIEQISIDEAFLDVSTRPESAEHIARGLQATIRTELGLPSSLGVASNKLVAKIANNVGKASAQGDGPPNAIQVVPAGKEAAFLAPLPCKELWGVGPKTAERLEALGLVTIGDLAAAGEDYLAQLLGNSGRDLARRALGLDDRPVVTEREAKSVSHETTFSQDKHVEADLLATLDRLAQGVSRDLQRKGLTGTTVKLKLRWSDFSTPTRQLTLPDPTADAAEISKAARDLFRRLWQPGRPVRLLGVGMAGLQDKPLQMSLFDPPDEREERLLATVQKVRSRFGDAAILRGSDLSGSAKPRRKR